MCYGLYDNEKIIGFIGILHQPHPINKKIKRVSRLVILPDYQGIGLGVKFLNEIAKIYTKKGFDFSIKTSAKNLIFALKNRKEWNVIEEDIEKTIRNVGIIGTTGMEQTDKTILNIMCRKQ